MNNKNNRFGIWQGNSLKLNIDPAFPHFIKAFSNLLEAWGLLAFEGYINLDKSDPYFQKIEKREYPSFEKFYEKLELDDLFPHAPAS